MMSFYSPSVTTNTTATQPRTNGLSGQSSGLFQKVQEKLAEHGLTVQDFQMALEQTGGNARLAMSKLGIHADKNQPLTAQVNQGRFGTKGKIGFGQTAAPPSESPEAALQMVQQQLAAKGLTLNDLKQKVEQTGDPVKALQQLGVQPPGLNATA
jgi:hypothetical protein